MIPLLHRLTRTGENKSKEWLESFTRYAYADPAAQVANVNFLLNALMVAALACGCIWLWIWRRGNFRAGWFPILAFSLIMLLFQNIAALLFWYEDVTDINMHYVFWIIYAGMVAISIFGKKSEAVGEPEALPPLPWKRWSAISIGLIAFAIFCSGFVNGEITMQSANTRWPVWVWTQGPFPGR
jgi:hypothetical protein